MRIGVAPPRAKLWLRRDAEWVPTVNNGSGRINYLQLPDLGDSEVILRWETLLGLWIVADMIPRLQGYVSLGSRRYNDWKTLAFEDTTNRDEVSPEAYEGPLVEQRSYSTPNMILKRQKVKRKEKVKDYSDDELQPNRDVIEGDTMQGVDENENDDGATKND